MPPPTSSGTAKTPISELPPKHDDSAGPGEGSATVQGNCALGAPLAEGLGMGAGVGTLARQLDCASVLHRSVVHTKSAPNSS